VPNTTFRIEFFATPGVLAGQGQTFLGFTDVATDAAGNAGFTATVAAIPDGQVVTATATSKATGDTSEFSAGLLAPALPPPPPAPPPVPVAPMPVTDVTPSVTLTVLKVRFDRRSRQTRLWLLLTNNGPLLPGPISFVLDGLTRGIALLSSSGITAGMFPAGSPFQDLILGPLHAVFISGGGLPGPAPVLEEAGGSPDLFAGGETRALLLVFRNRTGRALRFGWRVLAGVGGR
jgi:hypothetical protein